MPTRREFLASTAAIAAAPYIYISADTAARPWHPKAPPLPPPAGEVLRVGTADTLLAAVGRVKLGGTILLEDGHYHLRSFEIRTDNVTLRSASGRRENVILDGDFQGELVRLTACSGVTIADLTVQNVRWNGIKLNTDQNVQQAHIYNCVVRNVWQRFVKGVIVPERDRERIRPRGCRVEYCLFYNDRAKRYEDDPADTAQNFSGNYIGGIDVMYAAGWTISDNVFVGIKGRTGEGRGAVFLWHDIRDCVVERNVILDCDSGICLGNSFKRDDFAHHATGCIVRNNFLTRVPENGIFTAYTRDCKILHNTVYDPASRLGRLVRIVHDNDGLAVANNLLCGAAPRVESSSKIALAGNVAGDVSAQFLSPAEGNLRLKASVERVPRLAEVPTDLDRRPREGRTAVGAAEIVGPEIGL